jgi:predicted SprT family Zn-dependent metalloprotease
MEQLHLQLSSDGPGLKRFFEMVLKRPVELVLTNNAARMLSFRPLGAGIVLRLSKVFLSAPFEVLHEAASFIGKRGGPTPVLNRFLRRVAALPEKPKRRTRTRTSGLHHDLAPVFERINSEYFEGRVEAAITWSRRQPGRVRRRTLGSYCPLSRTVRINPVLDHPGVPALFLEFIVYHEMLHACVAIREKGGRRDVHSREFREKEKRFRGFEAASAWERANRVLL